MGDETCGTGEQDNQQIEHRALMAQRLDREKRATDGPDDRVNGVPGGIDPGNFVGKKLEEIQKAGEDDDPRLAKDFERLEAGGENDPMLVDGQAGDEDGEVKIDARETSEPQRHAQQVESIHAEISDAPRDCHLQSAEIFETGLTGFTGLNGLLIL